MASSGSIAGLVVRLFGTVVRVPVRFVAWVYQPDARRRPGRGELQTHRHAAQRGLDTARWVEDEQSLHEAEAAARRTAHEVAQSPKDP